MKMISGFLFNLHVGHLLGQLMLMTKPLVPLTNQSQLKGPSICLSAEYKEQFTLPFPATQHIMLKALPNVNFSCTSLQTQNSICLVLVYSSRILYIEQVYNQSCQQAIRSQL